MPVSLLKEPHKQVLQMNNSNLGYLLQGDFIINTRHTALPSIHTHTHTLSAEKHLSSRK